MVVELPSQDAMESTGPGRARERESTVCIRFTQVENEGSYAHRRVISKEVEADVLVLINLIRDQCFQQVENFVPGDIRYQGFEDLEGREEE